MKRVLLTGARAPATLDLARAFAHGGDLVYVADSLGMPLAKVSNSVQACFRHGEPKNQTRRFIEDLKTLIQTHHIDLLVPTCEEIFFIARFSETLGCEVFCDSFDKLASLHHKFHFTHLAQDLGMGVPETHLLESRAQVLPFLEDAPAWVFKPVFSRFAAFTLIGRSAAQLGDLVPTGIRPWVAQRRIFGRELCSYGVAYKGELRCLSCYFPRYRLHQSSGVYFEPVKHRGIADFVGAFVAKHQYHGQIGFDFIEASDGRLHVLECNPRVTSGIHLFDPCDSMARAFAPGHSLIEPADGKAGMIAPVMLTYILPRILARGGWRTFWRYYRRAEDAGHRADDPLPSYYRFLGIFELAARSLKRRISLVRAATADLEWDGEPL